MRTLSFTLALLLLAAGAPAQIVVGGASFTVGDEVVYSGGPSQGPQTKQVGLIVQLDQAVARFPADTCFGTQARLERAMVRARRDGKLAAGARLDEATFDALVDGRYLKGLPEDPEAKHGYSWWNFRQDYQGRVHCRSHGDFRKAPPPEDEAGEDPPED